MVTFTAFTFTFALVAISFHLDYCPVLRFAFFDYHTPLRSMDYVVPTGGLRFYDEFPTICCRTTCVLSTFTPTSLLITVTIHVYVRTVDDVLR